MSSHSDPIVLSDSDDESVEYHPASKTKDDTTEAISADTVPPLDVDLMRTPTLNSDRFGDDDNLMAFQSLEDARISGLLNTEELFMINKSFKKSDSTTQKDAKRSTNISSSFKRMNICSQNKVFSSKQTNNNAAVGRSDHVKISNETRKAQDFKRSELGGIPKSNSFASPTVVKVHRSDEPSSSACSKSLSKSIKSKVNPKNMKLVNSPSSGGPERKIKSSGLHTPSPKIGFFDKELGSVQNRCVSRKNDGRKVASVCSKLKPVGQIPKEILRNRKLSLDRKSQKDDCCSFQAEKENVLNFEDQVNDLSRQLEVIDLERDVVEVKGQQNHINFGDDNLQLLDFSEEDDYLIPFPYRDSLEDIRLSGLLNPEELLMVNTSFKKAPRTQKDVKRSKLATRIGGSQSNALCNNKISKLFSSNNSAAGVVGSDNVKTENKTRTAQDSTRSPSGVLPKSTSFTSPTTERFHRSYASSSSASSKNLSESIKRKVNPKNMKLVNSPSSVLHFPLSSSSTSPASSIDGWLSESSSSTPITHQKTIPVLDFQTPNPNERKFNSQNATIKSSGLRMPSPRIGFFDKEPGSLQDRFLKGQRIDSVLKPGQLSVLATASEHSTPYSMLL
ncbi:hypothetical protein L1987_42520 [Smallanthus sonchifolius]|uniref:Uncharacterized protein n=1 Tax=Smallanthus sonchifolius TaxID=185202 RepID=A0ACB9GK66_9ASTR|nr:hypothetical protein L1987_42520 [Smallanthus sonchifolius]